MRHQKRGQVTVFIIIGIVLLSLVSVFLYVRNIDEDIIVSPDIVPQEFAPVADYIRSCIDITMQSGLELMGQQGGYIYVPSYIARDPASHIPVAGDIKIPYWYYQGKVRIPTRIDMQADLDHYMEKNVPLCINDFNPFLSSFDVEELSNMSVKTTIGRTEVVATVNYNIKVSSLKDSSSISLSNFEGSAEVNIDKVLNLARDILDSENQKSFLETMTINLMALSPSQPRNKAIPFTDMGFTCGQIKWSVSDVKNQIKKLMFYNAPRIKIEDTDYIPFEDNEEYAKTNFLWKVSDNDYSDIKADIYYDPAWDMFMNVMPSDGDNMRSSSGKGPTKYLSYLCLNIYHFTYDIIYPVQVIIQDNEAFNKQGFTFRYAIPVQINHNAPDRANFGIADFELPINAGGDYCQRLSDRSFSVNVKSAITNEDLRDINVTYNCANSFYCPLGQTKSMGQTYGFSGKIPTFCSPGSIEAEGIFNGVRYQKERKMIESDKDYMDIYLTPLKGMDVAVQKHRTNLFDTPQFLEEGESAYIYLSSDQLPDFEVYRNYPIQQEPIELLMKNVTYQLYLLLLNKDGEYIGGYKSNWSIDSGMLDPNSKVIFKVAELIPHPQGEEEQALSLLKLENLSKTQILTPVLS